MLVEINLLPQKDPKKFNVFVLSALILILILVGSFYLWQIQSAKSDLAAVDSQIANTKKLTEKVQTNAQQNEVATSAGTLKTAVDWVKDYPIQTIPVMKHLTSLLPDRGFIQTFGYAETGVVTIGVQFDSARQAAYFLENLKESNWIEDASLSSLTVVETKEATATSTQTNTSAGTTTNQSTTGTVQYTSSVNSTTTQTTTNTNNTGVTTTATTTTTVEPDKNILPRYLGQFEIKFNKDVIKQDKDKKDGEGVTGS